VKKLSNSICRDFWMGRVRFSKASIAMKTELAAYPDKGGGPGACGSRASERKYHQPEDNSGEGR